MEPPYYAVIFSSELSGDTAGYEAMSSRMVELAKQQPGYLGIDSARDGLGITVSNWRDLASIAAWKANAEHAAARQIGRERWYRSHRVRVARVDVDYGLEPAAS